MIYHDVPQGSAGWLELRAKRLNASEAPAMMGCSKYQSRDELLKLKYAGEADPVSPQLQALFDRGHAAEATIRPHISELIGNELFPVTGSIEVDGLPLGASFDGLTMDESINFEHKLWNETLAEKVRNNDLDEQYKWQMDQQMMVSGAHKTIFVTSDGTPDKMEFCWYDWSPERAIQLLAGWKQFNEDLSSYVYTPEPELIKAEAVLSLPAVSIKVDGTIALIDNLDVFGEALKTYVDGINKVPSNDQDFANLEQAVKTLKSAEDALTAAENGALAQAASIDTMRRTVDNYRTMARDTRLIIDKLVKTQKEIIKNNIMIEARDALVEHIGRLNEGLGGVHVLYNADFKAVMKGKRTLTSLRGAANDELARAKIAANEAAEKYRANLKALDTLAADYKLLFNDIAVIIDKEPDDFVLLVNDRVAKQKQAEAEKLEVEREKIRQEEKAKLEREEAARIMAENRERAKDGSDNNASTSLSAENRERAEEVARIAKEQAVPDKTNALEKKGRDVEKHAEQAPVWNVTVTDKAAALKAILSGAPMTDINDAYINIDSLTEKVYRLNGHLSIPGIKVTNERVA